MRRQAIRNRHRWVGCFAALVLCACGARGSVQRIHPSLSPGPLLDPSIVRENFTLRQRVTIEWGEGESRVFDAVLEKRHGALKIVGLSPTGMPGFMIVQDPLHVKFENYTDRELPFAPEYMVADVQRAFFPWIRAEGGPAPEREGQRDGLKIHETYDEQGNLQERTFLRTDAPRRGYVHVKYSGPRTDSGVAEHVELQNDWFRYRLRIRTHVNAHH